MWFWRSVFIFLITCFLFLFYFLKIKTEQLLIYMIIPLIINLVFNLLGVSLSLKFFRNLKLVFGFLISFLMIYLFKYEKIHPSYLIWVVWLPVYDFLFVNLNRFYNKVSIFYEKDHVHHVMLFFGMIIKKHYLFYLFKILQLFSSLFNHEIFRRYIFLICLCFIICLIYFF